MHTTQHQVQFEYENRCLFTSKWWDAHPDDKDDEFEFIVPECYPQTVDWFPGYWNTTVVAEDLPIESISIVRTLIWSGRTTSPSRPEVGHAPNASLVDVGFTVAIGARVLPCFAIWLPSIGHIDVLDVHYPRGSLDDKCEFLSLDDAARSRGLE